MKCTRRLASTIGLSLSIFTASAIAAPADLSASIIDLNDTFTPELNIDTIDFTNAGEFVGENQDLVSTEIDNLPIDDQPVDITIADPGLIDPINTDVPSDSSNEATSGVITVGGTPADIDGPWIFDFKDLTPTATDTHGSGTFEDLVSMVQVTSDSGISPIAVPLPAAFAVGLATMAGAGVYFRKRRF